MMGKRKIEIKKIDNETKCQVTFSKRRGSLIKKAHEISILCDVDIALVVFSQNGRLYNFCSRARMEEVIQRYLGLPLGKRFHPTKNIQRNGNTTCLCHKAERLKQLEHIRGDENKLIYLKNQIKDLELQIKKSTGEIDKLHKKLKDYEPDPRQDLVPSQLTLIEENLKASLEQVKDRKTKLISKPPFYRRRYRVQKMQQEKERFNIGTALFQQATQNPTITYQPQQQSDSWICSRRSETRQGSNKDSLADNVTRSTLVGNGIVDFSGNFTGNLINYHPGYSSPGIQIPPAYSSLYQSNLNYRNIFSPPTSPFQAKSNELNWTANGTFNTYKNSHVNNVALPLATHRIFSSIYSEPFFNNVILTTPTTNIINNNNYEPYFTNNGTSVSNTTAANAVTTTIGGAGANNSNGNIDNSSTSSNNNGSCNAGLNSLSNEAGKGDGTLSNAGNLEDDSWNLDDINWDIEFNLEDLDI